MSRAARVGIIAVVVFFEGVAGGGGVSGGGGVARADGPTGPGRIVADCKIDADTPLCREVRRMCATREVRDDVVPACKELGWYGDTLRARIVNLCPIDAGHPACVEMREACDAGRAEAIEADAPRLCRDMGWGPYAYAPAPLPGTGDGGGGGGSGSGNGGGGGGGGGDDADVGPIVEASPADRARLGAAAPGSGDGGRDSGGGGGANVRDGDARPGFMLRPPRARAGLTGVGFRLGLALETDPPLGPAGEPSYGALIAWQAYAIDGLPLAGALDLELASADGFAYHGALLGGFGRFVRTYAAACLLGGVAVDGLDSGDESVPLAAYVPVRVAAQLHLERVTLAGWAQLAWQVAGDARAPAATWDGVDQISVGGTILVGGRGAANAPLKPRLWIGGIYEERGAARIVALVVGFGSAQDPWNL